MRQSEGCQLSDFEAHRESEDRNWRGPMFPMAWPYLILQRRQTNRLPLEYPPVRQCSAHDIGFRLSIAFAVLYGAQLPLPAAYPSAIEEHLRSSKLESFSPSLLRQRSNGGCDSKVVFFARSALDEGRIALERQKRRRSDTQAARSAFASLALHALSARIDRLEASDVLALVEGRFTLITY